MTTPYDHIDAYVDGQLSGDDLTRFEETLRTDDDLRREVELARRIDASIRSRFAPCEIPFELNGSPGVVSGRGAHAATSPHEAAPGSPARPLNQTLSQPLNWPLNWRRIGLITALAATVLLTTVLVLRFSTSAPQRRPTGTILERLYATYQVMDWEPAWVCEDDAEFAQAVQDRLGQPMLIDDDPRPDEPDLTVLGWAYGEDVVSYEEVITDKTMVLLTKVEGRGVVALVDRLDGESRPLRVPEGELTLHRRELGELVIYELTPLTEPHLLDRFFIPG
jgi:hypothetical protein